MEFICPKCGNKRFFYNEVSVMGKRLIDQKKGVRDGKIIEVDLVVDSEFEPIYCKKCDALVKY